MNIVACIKKAVLGNDPQAKIISTPLSGAEADEFLKLMDQIESKGLWNLNLHITVGDYMLRNGLTYKELLERYETVCPEYRKKDFPLKHGFEIAGSWVQFYRRRIYSKIYIKASNGESFDPKQIIEDEFISMPFPEGC